MASSLSASPRFRPRTPAPQAVLLWKHHERTTSRPLLNGVTSHNETEHAAKTMLRGLTTHVDPSGVRKWKTGARVSARVLNSHSVVNSRSVTDSAVP